jgi:isopenicillin-N N-acyltransferase-like protein
MAVQAASRVEVLRLKGQPGEMGFKHGTVLRERVQVAVEHFLRRSEALIHVPYPFILEHARECLEFIPRQYVDEMAGVAEGAGVPFDDVLALNCISDVDGVYTQQMFHCCNFVLGPPATRDGLFVHGRNLDYPVGDVVPYISIVIARDGGDTGVVSTASVGIAGMVGVFTGCSAEQIGIGKVVTPGRDISLRGIPFPLLMRRILEKAGNLDDAVKIAEEGPRTICYNLALSDGKSGTGCCIETTHSLCERRNPRRGALVVDDVCFGRKTGAMRLTYPAGAFRYARMIQLIKENFGNIDVELALEFLKDRYDMARGKQSRISPYSICNPLTIHSMLLVPREGRMYVSHGIGKNPDPVHGPVSFRELWD